MASDVGSSGRAASEGASVKVAFPAAAGEAVSVTLVCQGRKKAFSTIMIPSLLLERLAPRGRVGSAALTELFLTRH